MLRILNLCFCFLISSISYSQITITASDLPNTGDNLFYKQGTIFSITSVASGVNQNWNYANLSSNNEFNEEFFSVTSTNFIYILMFGTPFSPNMATVAKNEQFPITLPPQAGFTIENAIGFYKEQTQRFTQVGLGVEIQGFPVPIIYNPPDRLYEFPLEYGKRDTSDFAFNIDVPSLGYYGRKATRTNHVDAWGDLTLPGGNTYSCLRVKSIVNAIDSIQLDTLGFGFNIPIPTETKYKWLSAGHAWPVMEITTSTLFGFETINKVIYYSENVTDLDENPFQNVVLFPNPFNNTIFLQLNNEQALETEVCLLDAMGKMIHRRIISESCLLDFSDLQLHSGIYFMHINNGKEKMTKKIVKF